MEIERSISDRLLSGRLSDLYDHGVEPGLSSVLSRYPGITEYVKRKSVSTLGDITEFHCDIHVETLNNPEFLTNVVTLYPNQRLIQIVKAKATDLHDLFFSVKGVNSTSVLTIDNFNSYANTTALRTVWVPVGGTLTNPTLLTTAAAYEGGKSFSIAIRNTNQYVEKTYSTGQDWTPYYSFNFWHSSSQSTTGGQLRIRIGDTTNNFMYTDIPVGVYLSWHKHVIPFSLFVVESNPLNFTAISKIQLFTSQHISNTTEYLDLIELDPNVDETTYIETRIYDFGADEPTIGASFPSPMTFDDGTNYKKNFIKLTRSIIRVDFTLGHAHVPGVSPLVVGNYYGIEIKNPQAPSVIVYGSNTSYTDGGLFSVLYGLFNTNLNKSIGFLGGSHVSGYIYSVNLLFNDTPGYRSRLIFVYKDLTTNEVIEIPLIYSLNDSDNEITFNFLAEGRTYYVDENKFMLVYFQPNENTKATEISIKVKGCHKFGK